MKKYHMTFRGGRGGLRAEQFITLSVSLKHKKDKKSISAYRLNLFFYQANKTSIHTLSVLFVVQSNIQLQQKEAETNSYLYFQQSACLTFLSWGTQLNLITIEIYNYLSNMWVLSSKHDYKCC